ncbi:reticulon-1 isoform X3 [Orussus abietinus]|uniref:reticulon-1 isoform X3 n=1 Tax=Orussus abietinus TaxID=222816 RepID=UPI0006251E7D|nr:reticulon-1 isoform X3 [Orussus abietinus]
MEQQKVTEGLAVQEEASKLVDVDPLARMKRDHESMDDFEHLEHDVGARAESQQLIDLPPGTTASESASGEEELKPERTTPATPPPSADSEKLSDPAHQLSAPLDKQLDQVAQLCLKEATAAFMESERSPYGMPTKDSRVSPGEREPEKSKEVKNDMLGEFGRFGAGLGQEKRKAEETVSSKPHSGYPAEEPSQRVHETPQEKEIAGTTRSDPNTNFFDEKISDAKTEAHFLGPVTTSVQPVPEKAPILDFLREDPPSESKRTAKGSTDEDSWNLLEKPDKSEERDAAVEEAVFQGAPTKPLPPLPREANAQESSDLFPEKPLPDKFVMSNDFLGAEAARGRAPQHSGTESGDSEFESEPEPSPAKVSLGRPAQPAPPARPTERREEPAKMKLPLKKREEVDEIAPKQIFRDMGLDAWFNPERLNPKVAALIYWRDPKKSGSVFGAILGVLLSLAYFSLISVLAYVSLLALCGTMSYRIYKAVLQALQKTSDGHPFKEILELDVTLSPEKVREVADIAVVHANAAIGELRRLFLVEDMVDSFKFGVTLWCLTYLGSWFNGMTLIIIGVVALFTLPKVYETNKAQIDQNLALVQGKVNEITAKVKAAIPFGKKIEPTKEE